MTLCGDWDAWWGDLPGEDDLDLHVVGRCAVQSSSAELRLRLGDVGIVANPSLIALDLRISAPETGDECLTIKDVGWHGRASRQVRRVRIQGTARASIEIRGASPEPAGDPTAELS